MGEDIPNKDRKPSGKRIPKPVRRTKPAPSEDSIAYRSSIGGKSTGTTGSGSGGTSGGITAGTASKTRNTRGTETSSSSSLLWQLERAQQEEEYLKSVESDKLVFAQQQQQALLDEQKRIELHEQRVALAQRVLPEPENDSSDEIITISFRFQLNYAVNRAPIKIERRFRRSDTLENVFDFIESHDELIKHPLPFELSLSFPKRTFTRQENLEYLQESLGSDVIGLRGKCVVFARSLKYAQTDV